MSDNRKRPIARRFKPETEALLQVYAKSRNITANEAAEQLLHGNAGVVVDAAAEIKKLRAAVTRAENVALAREKQRDDALADLRCAETLRAELESAREATRRADAEVERLTAEATVRAREYAAAAAKLGAETDRLTRELARERASDEAAQEALRADVAREIAANRKLEAELAETRAALATKGATERLAERLETIAVDVDRRACACALPDDLAPRLAAIAARRDVEPHVMLANVIKNGISKIEASDKYQDAQKAARARS